MNIKHAEEVSNFFINSLSSGDRFFCEPLIDMIFKTVWAEQRNPQGRQVSVVSHTLENARRQNYEDDFTYTVPAFNDFLDILEDILIHDEEEK